MRKIRTVLLAAAVLITGMVYPAPEVQAQDGQSREAQAQVSYDPDLQTQFHTLSLTVRGGGKAVEGGQSIRNGTVTFEMKAQEEKTFELLPDQGYRLGKATSSNAGGTAEESLLNQVKNNRLTVSMAQAGRNLEVVFEKMPDEKQKSPEPVKTGDGQSAVPYILLLCGAGILMAGKRKNRTKDA